MLCEMLCCVELPCVCRSISELLFCVELPCEMLCCVAVSDECMTYLTANTIQFSRSYLSFCDDLLKVYTANRHHLITSAFTDIFSAHVNSLQKAASADKFKQEVRMTSRRWDDCTGVRMIVLR